jgi:hypothetical protein
VNDFKPITYLRGSYNTRGLNDDAFEFGLKVVSNGIQPISPPIAPSLHTGPSLTSWNAHPVDVHLAVSPLLDLVYAAGPNGLTRAELEDQTGYPAETLMDVYALLAADSPTEVFWAGYDTARLISVEHWNEWTVAVKDRQVKPRRWTTISGEVLQGDWERCLRCTAAQIATRPGITIVSKR